MISTNGSVLNNVTIIIHHPFQENSLESLKETLLRQWYHLEETDFASGEASLSNQQDVLLETDSEGGEILVQSDSDQDCLGATPPDDGGILHATDSEGDEEPPRKKPRRYVKQRAGDHHLVFLKRPVCRFAHLRLYGVGSSALQNVRSGSRAYTMHEGRLDEPKHPLLKVSMVRSSCNKRWPSIMSFFWLLWMSSAEILPIKFTMPGHKERVFAESSLSTDPDFQERYVQNFLGCLEKNYDMNPATQRAWKHFPHAVIKLLYIEGSNVKQQC